MRELSNTTGSVGAGSPSGENRNITNSFTGKDYYQALIEKANTIPINLIFSHYGIRLDEINRKTVCPFKSHKGGKESTPSFYFYPKTNTYCCFGCRIGSNPCDFVAEMEGLTKVNAAYKVLELFNSEVDGEFFINKEDLSERLQLILSFSEVVRNFIHKYIDNEHAIAFIEHKCKVYDDLNLKYKNFNNLAISRIIDQLKEEIASWK